MVIGTSRAEIHNTIHPEALIPVEFSVIPGWRLTGRCDTGNSRHLYCKHSNQLN
jgi:hypothetical protein